MKGPPLYLALCVMMVLALGTGQEISYHPPSYARNYSISYNVSPKARAFPPYNVTSPDDYMYFAHYFLFPNTDDDTVIIGAKDWLFKLSDDLNVTQSLLWNLSSAEFNDCSQALIDKKRVSQIEYECGNHIRVYREFPNVGAFSEAQGRMLVCGSFGLNPKCITVNITDINDVGEPYDTTSSGICSVHPDAPTFGDFHGGNDRYFAMGFSDDRGKDFPAGMYKITYDSTMKSITIGDLPVFGIPSENQWIASKVEIIDFRVQNYPASGEVYIIFLRENFQSTGSTTGTVQSRILRICKNDEGSNSEVGSPSIKYFRSFTKARLVCRHSVPDLPSSTGINEFDWPALRAVAYTESDSRFYGFDGIWSQLVYGMFTGQIYAANGTAICVYDIDPDPLPLSIDDHYTAYNIFRDSTFVGEDPMATPNLEFFDCTATPRDDTDARQTLAVDNVGPYLDNKYPLLEMDGIIGTKLATDTACVKDQLIPTTCLVQDVLFVGTANGRVMKVVISARYAEGSGVLTQAEPQVYNNYDYAPVVSEEWTLDDSSEVMALVVRGDFLYVSTASRVYKIPKHDCPRYTTCSSCLASQDPYCYWRSSDSKCVTFSHDNTDSNGRYTLPPNYHQNISSGEDQVCNGTPRCELQCVSKNGGFNIDHDCSDTKTLSYNVSSACGGQGFISETEIPYSGLGSPLEIDSESILGNRLHIVDVHVTSSGGAESTYSLQCRSEPTEPEPVQESEIIAIPASASEVDILVGLRACSLTDDPGNYNITVEAYTPLGFSETFAYSGQTSVSLPSLEECTSFSYSVRVTNSRGSIMYMSPENATVVPGTPGMPTAVALSGHTSRGTDVTWTDPVLTPCGISGYSIYLNGQRIYRCLPLDLSSFSFTGLFPFSNYTVVIHACSMAGEGPASDPLSFTTSCEPPSHVRNLYVEERTPSTLRFAWDEPLLSNGSDFSYTVESVCYNQVNLSVNSMEDPSVSAPTFTLSPLLPLTLCCIKVFQTATCMGEELSGLPVQMCNTTLADTPACPTNLIATPTSYRSLLIQWDAPSNAILGLIYTVRVEPTEMVISSLDNTFAFVNGLEPNTSYNIHLSVNNMGGSGSGSGSGTGECTSAVGHTPVGPPPAPINVELMTPMECTLSGSWSDPFKSSYSVASYQVYARCNDFAVMDTISSDAMAISFNICDASGALPLGGDLSWCTLQVQSCDGISCGQLSELALAMVPESVPAPPLCFITEEVGTSVFISYTVSAPFALHNLSVRYSLVQTSDMLSVVEGDKQFDGDNVINFTNLFRDQEYSFSLQLCDLGTKCGGSCNIIFVPNVTTPAYPRNLRCNTTSTAVTVDWDMLPDENADAVEVEVQLGGGRLVTERNMTVKNGGLSTSFTGLTPFMPYFVTARTVDTSVEISSPPSPAIECRTLSAKPPSLLFISSRVGTIGEVTSLTITWQRPDHFNGNFSSYTFVWSGQRRTSCQELYNVPEPNIQIVTDYNLTSVTVTDPGVTADIARADVIQLCGRVSNTEFTSDWLEETSNTTTGALSESEPTSTALIIVVVLAVLSIIAAVLIAVILAIAICSRRNTKLTPTENVEDMNRNQTPRSANVQRSMSTKPIMEDDDQIDNNHCNDNNDHKRENNSSKYDI